MGEMQQTKQKHIWIPGLGHDHKSTRLLCDAVSISVKLCKNTLILNSLYSATTHYILSILFGAVHPLGASQSFSTIFGWFFFISTWKAYPALKKKKVYIN